MLKKIILVLCSLYCLAIASYAQGVPMRKQVAKADGYCTDRSCPAWIQYLRPGEESWGPVFWLTAYDGTRCEVTGMIQARLRYGQTWECVWRSPR